MGILELQGFKAQAEVLGRSACVEWDGLRLIVEDVDLDFAKRMLDRLAIGTLTVVDPMVGDTLEKPLPPGEDAAIVQRAKAEVVIAPLAAQAQVVELQPQVQPPPIADATPVQTLVPQPGGYLEALQGCSKLRDVINIMRDKMGIEGEAALVAECEAKKADVPTLRAISNIKDRVARTLAIMDGRD